MSGKYVVAILTGTTDKGYTPLDKLKDKIKMGVMNDKKIAVLTERVKKSMTVTKDLYKLASEFGSKVDTSSQTFSGYTNNPISRDADVTGLLFTLKKGVLSGPFSGKYNVYVVLIDNISEPPKTDNYMAIKNQIVSGFAGRVSNGLFDAIKKSAEVKDSRAKFY